MTPAEIVAAAQLLSGLMQRALDGQLGQQALEELRALSEREFAAGLDAWRDSGALQAGESEADKALDPAADEAGPSS